MKRLLTSVAIAAGLMACAVPVSATVLTFDDLAGADLLPATYGGLQWSGWIYFDWEQDPYTPASGPTRLFDFSNDDNSMSSSTGFTFQGADFSGDSSTFVQFNLYFQGSLVASSASLTTSSVPTFLSSGYLGWVDQVVVLSNAPGFFAMDNVTFDVTPSPIPEPATYASLLGGLLAVGAVARKRRASA